MGGSASSGRRNVIGGFGVNTRRAANRAVRGRRTDSPAARAATARTRGRTAAAPTRAGRVRQLANRMRRG